MEALGQVFIPDLGLDWRIPVTQSAPEVSLDSGSIGASSADTHNSTLQQEVERPDSSGTILHVLPGLPCDIILGREFLERSDAFNLCPDLQPSRPGEQFQTAKVLQPRTTERDKPLAFNILINIGPVGELAQKLFGRRAKRRVPQSNVEIHDAARRAEEYRRHQREERIQTLDGMEKRRAQQEEQRQRKSLGSAARQLRSVRAALGRGVEEENLCFMARW
ncbi:hypothetical protein F5Y15DRAFT_269679 [Xylariaceae sp. FL0016]|nr:hypothetical protein F5Y15DRAFT_269679 [Xylariaceae sp. FL0016]